MAGNSNWAGNLEYSTERVARPQSLAKVQEVVRKAKRLHAISTRHSFTPVADSDSEQISLRAMKRVIAIDAAARTVTVEGGITYGELAPKLHEAGFAIRNTASLTTVTIAGATASATHGSGNANQNLAGAVSGVTLVTANGEIVSFKRGDAEFDGVVVSLGALGVIVEMTLDIQPTFEARQEVYTGLPFETLARNFDDIMGGGYSISLFHNWTGDVVPQVWVKSLATSPRHSGNYFGAVSATERWHPMPGFDPATVTEQMGVHGPWHLRLPHVRDEMMATSGNEIQAEYFVPRKQAGAALRAVKSVQERMDKVMLVGEIRTVAADTMWLSTAFERDCVAIHFAFRRDWPGIKAVLPDVEAVLRPFDPRPHWSKVFTMPAAEVQSRYPKLPEFRALRKKLDPQGKFSNAFVDEYIG